MRKFISLLAVFAVLLSATGCSSNNVVTYNPVAPYWQDDISSALTSTYSEVCTYSVDYAPLEERGNIYLTLTIDSENSYYKTTVKPATLGETSCALFTAETKVKGVYTVKNTDETQKTPEMTYEFDDYSVSKTWFNWNGGIHVLKTEEKLESSTPVVANGAEDKNGNRFVKLACTITTEYGDQDATTKLEITSDESTASYFSLADGYEGTFKKYKSSNYVDRNMLAFALRSFDFAKDLSYSFSTIDVLGNKKHSMKYTCSSSETAEEIKNLKENGVVLGKENTDESGSFFSFSPATYEMKIAVNETYGGTPLYCKYITGEKKDKYYYHYLYTMKTNIPYSLGTYTYTLKNIERTR